MTVTFDFGWSPIPVEATGAASKAIHLQVWRTKHSGRCCHRNRSTAKQVHAHESCIEVHPAFPSHCHQGQSYRQQRAEAPRMIQPLRLSFREPSVGTNQKKASGRFIRCWGVMCVENGESPNILPFLRQCGRSHALACFKLDHLRAQRERAIRASVAPSDV